VRREVSSLCRVLRDEEVCYAQGCVGVWEVAVEAGGAVGVVACTCLG